TIPADRTIFAPRSARIPTSRPKAGRPPKLAFAWRGARASKQRKTERNVRATRRERRGETIQSACQGAKTNRAKPPRFRYHGRQGSPGSGELSTGGAKHRCSPAALGRKFKS